MSRIERLRNHGVEAYPARVNRSHSVLQARGSVTGGRAAVIAGRLVQLDPLSRTGVLKDWSGTIDLALSSPDLSEALPLLSLGDLVECGGTWSLNAFDVAEIKLLAPCLRGAPEPEAADAVRIRADVMKHTRSFFESRGFIGVDTPTFMTVPDTTPALRSFRTEFVDEEGGSQPFYLQTSPEHYMKRLLSAGCERIYQICRFYRNGERYDTHHPEFTGLEWYEAFADYESIMETTEAYVAALAESIVHSSRISYQRTEIDLRPPWPRYRVRDFFLDRSGIDLDKCDSRDEFAAAVRAKGYEARADDTWDDLFHRVFLTKVEPALPAGQPVFLTEYPARLPSLARHVPGDDRYVERFELYMGGLELANAFTELNDPVEQRRRFEAELRKNRAAEGYEGGVDEALLAALEYGMPPSGGIAFGLDRLAMVFADVPTIDPMILFRNY